MTNYLYFIYERGKKSIQERIFNYEENFTTYIFNGLFQRLKSKDKDTDKVCT